MEWLVVLFIVVASIAGGRSLERHYQRRAMRKGVLAISQMVAGVTQSAEAIVAAAKAEDCDRVPPRRKFVLIRGDK